MSNVYNRWINHSVKNWPISTAGQIVNNSTKRFSKYTIYTTLKTRECIQLTFLKSRVQDLAQTGLNDSGH